MLHLANLPFDLSAPFFAGFAINSFLPERSGLPVLFSHLERFAHEVLQVGVQAEL
jgi:hypothetical protein